MRRILCPSAWIAAAGMFCLASCGPQNVQTAGTCSPVTSGTQGNVTINSTCTSDFTPAQLRKITDAVQAGQATPAVLELSQRFGVTRTAVETFFRTLGQENIAIEDLDARLREVAALHLTLLKQTKRVSGANPQVEALEKAAIASIDAGDYEIAEPLYKRAL